MSRTLKTILSFFCVVVFVPFGFALLLSLVSGFSGTSVSFQSSDGLWGDGEILSKGRNFDTIVVLFERYKISCNANEAKLQRVTRKPEGISIQHFFNNYSDPKWLVPFVSSAPQQKISAFEPECKAKGVSGSENALAHERATAYIARLKMHNNSGERNGLP